MMKKTKFKKDERLGFWHNFLYEFGITFAIVFLNSYGLIMLYNRLLQESVSVSFFSVFVILYLVFGCIISAGLVYIIRARTFSRNIQRICQAAQKVAGGDFTVRLDVYEDKKVKTEIDILKEDFNKMVEELSSIERLRNDFVADVSHEIKTPLSVIQGYADLLQNSNLDKETRKEYIDLISKVIHGLSGLVSNVLRLNKIENQGIVQKEKFFLDEQIRCCILSFEEKIEEKNLQMKVDLQETVVKTDRALLELVWNNLISNAIKFSKQGGEIRIGLVKNDEQIVFTIQDNGCGIDSETQKHIFDKFYQGDQSHSQEGNGLGLALVKNIVDKLGGEVSVKSRPGEGAEFIVLISYDD